MRERLESRTTLRLLALATGRMQLSLTEKGKTGQGHSVGMTIRSSVLEVNLSV